MDNSTGTQTVLFDDLADKPIVARFGQEHASSDSGAILLKAVDQRRGLSEALAACLVDDRHRRRKRRVKRIMIDLDPTDNRTHGNQQLSLFNGHYDSWCYLPLAGILTFDAEPEQYLF